MLDLHKLEIFQRVVREGSFSRAAETLFMTQPAVSQHIQDLETQLGTQLFLRERRGVSLTPEGETLHSYTLKILQLMAEAENAITDVRKLATGQLTLGATPGVSIYLLPDDIQAFRAQYPQLSVTLQTGITPQIVQELRGGQIELGFIEGELDAVTSAQLGVLGLQEVEQHVVVGPKHPWWTRKMVTLGELDRQPFIMRQPTSQTRIWLERVLDANAIHPKISAEFDNVESIKRTVMLGMCLTILPAYVVSHEVATEQMHAIAVENSPLQRTLKLIWDKERHFSPVATAFLRHLSGRFPALTALKLTR
ncbi:MAG: LysR family transcriptional regulator [Caldilineaceae bacterium]|nr:LysR family transcriptional regulator [Caldilineaceae bacterium]